ncbi:hypothetical protein Ahy_B10g104740 isoform B [Arachis hypogaea]|uniref:Uncharacterized protein n=1 Tax=Arachis hypogaea TaxID=3818 RepID=A0A444X6D6_ARAHY|nr:hypothetical protein Ahy_B10g104740 isoform B [Arachis hypogaea]
MCWARAWSAQFGWVRQLAAILGLSPYSTAIHRMYKPLPIKSYMRASYEDVTTRKVKSLKISTVTLTLIK